MQITPPNEDSKLQALNKPAELRGAETQPVNELEETTRIAPVPEQREQLAREHEQRRHGQRRQHQTNTLLDTRGHRERRTSLRREEDQEIPIAEHTKNSTMGIDVEA